MNERTCVSMFLTRRHILSIFIVRKRWMDWFPFCLNEENLNSRWNKHVCIQLPLFHIYIERNVIYILCISVYMYHMATKCLLLLHNVYIYCAIIMNGKSEKANKKAFSTHEKSTHTYSGLKWEHSCVSFTWNSSFFFVFSINKFEHRPWKQFIAFAQQLLIHKIFSRFFFFFFYLAFLLTRILGYAAE